MLASTTDNLPGYEIVEVLGIVRGFSMKGFSTILSSFTDPSRIKNMCEEVRSVERTAFNELLERAKEFGADAVIGLKLSPTSYEYDNALKYHATIYGTAIKLDRKPPEKDKNSPGEYI